MYRKIDIKKCQGYIWMSNEKKPCVIINKDYTLELDATMNPFIIEAQLCSMVSDGKSYSIKYIDGEYYIMEYEANKYREVSECEKMSECKYIPNHMKGVGHLKFIQNWELVEDPFCENMKVLEPAELVFVGFELNEENKNQ